MAELALVCWGKRLQSLNLGGETAIRQRYLDLEIGMEQGLELEGLITLVTDDQCCDKALSIEGNAVEQSELIGPELLGIIIEVFRRQAEIEFDTMRRAGALASGLSEEFPARIAGESMLGELGSSFVVGGGAKYLRTKKKAVNRNDLIIYGSQVAEEMGSRTYREDDGNAAANRL